VDGGEMLVEEPLEAGPEVLHRHDDVRPVDEVAELPDELAAENGGEFGRGRLRLRKNRSRHGPPAPRRGVTPLLITIARGVGGAMVRPRDDSSVFWSPRDHTGQGSGECAP